MNSVHGNTELVGGKMYFFIKSFIILLSWNNGTIDDHLLSIHINKYQTHIIMILNTKDQDE